MKVCITGDCIFMHLGGLWSGSVPVGNWWSRPARHPEGASVNCCHHHCICHSSGARGLGSPQARRQVQARLLVASFMQGLNSFADVVSGNHACPYISMPYVQSSLLPSGEGQCVSRGICRRVDQPLA